MNNTANKNRTLKKKFSPLNEPTTFELSPEKKALPSTSFQPRARSTFIEGPGRAHSKSRLIKRPRAKFRSVARNPHVHRAGRRRKGERMCVVAATAGCNAKKRTSLESSRLSFCLVRLRVAESKRARSFGIHFDIYSGACAVPLRWIRGVVPFPWAF